MSTPDEDHSTECHLFRLAPELRAVIYDMVFEDVDFDDDDGSDTSGSDVEVIDEGETEAASITEEVDSIEGVIVEDEEEAASNEDETANYSSQLTRPALLNTCKLIRQEAAPLYNYRLTLIGIEILDNTTDHLTRVKQFKDVAEATLVVFTPPMKWPINDDFDMSVRTRKCIDAMEEAMGSLGMRLGEGSVQTENVKFREALEKYEEICSRLFEA